MNVKNFVTNPKTLIMAGLLSVATIAMTPIDELLKLKLAENQKQDLQEQYDKGTILEKVKMQGTLDKAKENVARAEIDYNNFYNTKQQQINSAIDFYRKQVESIVKE